MSNDLRKLRLLYQDASMLLLSLTQKRTQLWYDDAPDYLFLRVCVLIDKARLRRDRRQAAFITALDAQPIQRPPFPIISAAIAEHGAAILTKEGIHYVTNR